MYKKSLDYFVVSEYKEEFKKQNKTKEMMEL